MTVGTATLVAGVVTALFVVAAAAVVIYVTSEWGYSDATPVGTFGQRLVERAVEMTDSVMVCWNCHTLVDGDRSECPVCKAGIVALGGADADERWQQGQQHLKRQLGVSDSDERVVRPDNQRKGMSTGAKFAVFVGGMLVSLVVIVGILLGYVLSTFPDVTGPGTEHYLDTHLCSEVPEPVVRQILEEECEALSSGTCVLSLGVAAATRLEDGLWLGTATLSGPQSHRGRAASMGFP